MSRQFYDRALSIFLHFVVVFAAFSVAGQLLVTYVLFQNQFIYACFLIDLVFTGFFGITFFKRLHDFKGNLELFVPENEIVKEKIEPLNIQVDDKPLKICLWYRNGATLEEIRQNLCLNHATQVRRELQKGLTFLLKFYDEHKEEKTRVSNT
jgi:hypothetical protein